ncbi:unnamed protein product [Mesocestoides corti]|uniref:Uncharacterized protein n=1 Tax=Mesocestoides corti TaxID=53468 RepID=A0A158QSH5_MESCO|nr:unnamed protein product [Mesocestoides corti]
MLNPGLQHCLSNEAELLNFLEIVNSDSTDITAFKIQDELENNLVKYLQHFSFFIEVKKQCAGNPPVQNVDLTSPDWKAEVAEFLWDATEQAVRNYSRAHQSRTAAEIWTLSDARDESVFNKLRMEQQQSYVRMEQLIEQFMVPERLFGEHLGQTCLMGSSENCWNGHKFTDEYERVADFTRIGQMTNPAVKVTNAELGYFSTRLGAKMSARSQAIRTLLHKIRRRSTGEEEFLPMPVQPSSHLKHFTEEDDNLTFHPIAPPIDIDDEGLQANYLYEESSGLPIEYGGEWNSLLPDHPGTLGNFTFGSLDEASRGKHFLFKISLPKVINFGDQTA